MNKWLLASALALLGHPLTAAPGQNSDTPRPDAQGNYRFVWKDTDGLQREFLYVPAGKIAPHVTVAISPYLDGWRLFDYTFGNEHSAQQRLHACVGTVAMPTRTESTPADWEGRQPSDTVPRVGWYLTRLSNAGEKDGIPPGEDVPGFQLASGSLPGVIEFQCRSDQDPTSVDREVLPEWVVNEVDRIPWSVEEVRVRTIGPAIASGRLIELVERIVGAYRDEFLTSKHSSKQEVAAQLSKVSEAAARDDAATTGAVFKTLDELLQSPQADRWSHELAEGLRVCIAHVLSRL
jgi:hypothetical protein